MDIISFKECSRDSKQLIELLKRNFDDHFDFHPEFYDEFVELVINSGSEHVILSALIKKTKNDYRTRRYRLRNKMVGAFKKV